MAQENDRSECKSVWLPLCGYRAATISVQQTHFLRQNLTIRLKFGSSGKLRIAVAEPMIDSLLDGQIEQKHRFSSAR